MNSTIGNKLFKSKSCNFTSYRLEAGNRNSFGSIINDKVNTCNCFNCSDISTLTADNTTFHFIVRNCNNRNCCFCSVVSSATLNCTGDNLTCKLIHIVFNLLLVIKDFSSFFVSKLFFKSFKNNLFSLLFCVTGNSFKDFKLTLFKRFNLKLFSL